MTKQSVGKLGEELATQYLESRGIHVFERNVKLGGVEADILAKDGKETVVVEVKTKSSSAFGLPQEMVGYYKQRQLRKFVRYWLAINGEGPIRVDVIAITLTEPEPTVEHLKNVVEGD